MIAQSLLTISLSSSFSSTSDVKNTVKEENLFMVGERTTGMATNEISAKGSKKIKNLTII